MHLGNVVEKSEESKLLDRNIDKLLAIKQLVESGLFKDSQKHLSLSVQLMVTKSSLESIERIAHIEPIR